MSQSRVSEQKKLKKKAELLWRLVITTSGLADLAEPMKRVEHYFERLTKRQRVTVAMIATQFEKGCHEIDSEIEAEAAQETQVEEKTPDTARIAASASYGKTEGPQATPAVQIVEADEVIPPNQDEIGDGSTTGD